MDDTDYMTEDDVTAPTLAALSLEQLARLSMLDYVLNLWPGLCPTHTLDVADWIRKGERA